MSGIFNWCLEGLWLIRECGFEPPESVRAATDEYRKQSDKIGRFVAEEMEADSFAETRTSEAYTRYKEWCQENGHYPENSANFNALMETIAPIRRQRPHDGGEKTTLILGYKLNMQSGASWGNVL